MEMRQADRDTLRSLAQRYLEAARSDAQKQTQRLWADLNNGRMQRPMVLVDQIPWHEMDVDGSLTCTVHDPYWRGVEEQLRRALYQWEYMRADMVLPPYLCLPAVLRDPAWRDMGVAIDEDTACTDARNDVVSHAYRNQFETLDDVSKIRFTTIGKDEAAETRVREQAADILEGLPWVIEGVHLNLGLWDTIAMWMGVEACYYMLADDPDLLHAVMARSTQVAARWIEEAEQGQLFDTARGICHCSCTLTEPFPDTPKPGTVRNGWAHAQAQLFTSASPRVTEEFEAAYMKCLFSGLGNVYYGCCERLDDRLERIVALPNVRKISCSPWSDPEAFAAKLPAHIVMSAKPNPALVGAGDLDAFRSHVRGYLDAARRGGVRAELIMKDLSSVGHRPERLWDAVRAVMEEVDR